MAREKTLEIDEYHAEIKKFPLLTAEEERELARAMHAGDKAARERLIRCNLRLVVSLAQKYKSRGMTFADLVEEGNMGLIRGIERFDPDAGTRISTYVSHWIKKTIRAALSQSGGTIRVPTHVVEMISSFKQKEASLAATLGRPPSIEEIADALKLSDRDVLMLTRAMRAQEATGIGSFDTLVEQSADTKGIQDRVADAFEGDVREKIEQMLVTIDTREANVLRMRFGLNDEAVQTLAQVAKKLKLSRERIRQIENEALGKLSKIFGERAGDKTS